MSVDSSDSILSGLTREQREAVCHVDGPLLILAGPGSGKTRVVTHRIAYLLDQGIPAHQLLALTFTNKAADEMRSRLRRLAPGQDVWMGTFHRFCARLLRRYADLVGLEQNYSILDVADSRQALRLAIADAGMQLSYVTPDKIADRISWAKQELIGPDEYTPAVSNPEGALVAQVYPAYQKRLLAANAVDFDDLLLHVGLLLRDNPELRAELDERYRYVLVDEYQDTNMSQYAIVRGLSIDHPNLAVTGDPDQSIYGWRGANISNILGFERDYADVRVVALERNYRSTKKILHVADQLIENNRHRKPKRLFTDNPAGDPVRLTTYSTGRNEAESIVAEIGELVESGQRSLRDIAVLYRTNSLSRSLEASLTARGIPYQIVGGLEFYQRREVKDLLAYLHVINNSRNDVALLRIINSPPRGIGRTTIKKLSDYADDQQIPLLEAARQAGMVPGLASRSAVQVARFVSLYDRLCEAATGPVCELVRMVIVESGYEAQLKDGSEEDASRLANLSELAAAAAEFDGADVEQQRLDGFLEQSSLVADIDDWDSGSERVTLMTLHAAKGLEFPLVYIIAIEHGLLPHERSTDNEAELEEERRLLFVGITRAQHRLHLSLAARRTSRAGADRPSVPSLFLLELPREEMENIELVPLDTRRSRSRQNVDEYAQCDPAGGDIESDSEFADDIWHDVPPDDEPSFDIHDDAAGGAADSSAAPLRTAAGMIGDGDSATATDGPLRVGMLVTHPEYGAGKIHKLAGPPHKRTAAVHFFEDASLRTFRLAHCPLQPLH